MRLDPETRPASRSGPLRAFGILAFFLGCVVAARAEKPDLDIPPDSPVLQALRRLETRNGAVLPSHGPPLRAGQALSMGASGRTAYDSAVYLSELPYLRRDLWAWSDTVRRHSLYLSPVARLGYQTTAGAGSDSDQSAVLTGAGLTVYGKLFSRLTYYTHALIYIESTDRAQFAHQFDPRYGETYSVEKGPGDGLLKDRTFNRFEEYILLDLPYVTLKAGRDRVRMGPGYFSSLMAGSDTPPYYMLEARVDFAPWLSLDNYLLKMTDTDHDILKYANLHRFEFRPRPWIEIAFQDMVIYQNRDPDWAYALPLVPLTFAEANNGGRDNASMGFDFMVTRIRNLSFWGELFLDDLLGPTAFFDDFWENRWAGLAGFQITSPWRAADADLVVEYGHVEPWTYNGRAPQTSFRHFNVPSASKLGPDSRSLDVQASWRPNGWLQLRSRAEWNEKGTARGSTLGVIHADSIDGTGKTFLGGNPISQRVFTQEAEARWRQYVTAKAWWSRRTGSRPEDRAGIEILASW